VGEGVNNFGFDNQELARYSNRLKDSERALGHARVLLPDRTDN
jgi:hypothetical protein